jgi:hypothetical protein
MTIASQMHIGRIGDTGLDAARGKDNFFWGSSVVTEEWTFFFLFNLHLLFHDTSRPHRQSRRAFAHRASSYLPACSSSHIIVTV